jgi:hypothetical protein
MDNIEKSSGVILKTDLEARMVYGWASVITKEGETFVDSQGDVISETELVSATTKFMEDVRIGKAMHTGEPIGTIVHSLPVTGEIKKSLGLSSDQEGWVVGFKVHDDEVWELVKSGKLTAFSIGGRGTRVEV